MGIKFRTLAIMGTLGLGGTMLAAAGADEPASVVRVIDGDTIVAAIGDEEKRVRLLNIDTPELGGNDTEPECLAEEARDYLSNTLPPGTEVELRYDEDRKDQYGRELAAVFSGDKLVNAEIARQGLGVAVTFEPNDRYRWDVEIAENEAVTENRGIHDPTLECSVPNQVATVSDRTTALLAVATGAMTVSMLEKHIDDVDSLLREARHLLDSVKSPSQFSQAASADHSNEKRGLEQIIRKLEREAEESTERISDIEEKEEQERRERQLEEQQFEQRQKEERERRQSIERWERSFTNSPQFSDSEPTRHETKSPESPVVPSQTSAPQPVPRSAPASESANGGTYDGYTGCRAYGGNYEMTSTDEKGRSYAKIDCATKAQIG